MHKKSPYSKIIVTGCFAQLDPDRIYKIPGVAYVVSAENKFNIDYYLDFDSKENIINDILRGE